MTILHKKFFLLQSVRGYIHIPHLLENVVRSRPMYVRLALWNLHHPDWVEGHTGGSRLTPTIHPCSLREEAVGGLTNSMSPMIHK